MWQGAWPNYPLDIEPKYKNASEMFPQGANLCHAGLVAAKNSRSKKSRDQLVAAAGAVISSEGLHELTMRHVAERADLSPALVSYHYPSRGDLVLAVHRDVVSTYIGHRSASILGRLDPRERLLASVLAGVPPYAPTEQIVLLFELHGLARRSQPHAALMSQLWDAEIGLYSDVVADGLGTGVFSSEQPTQTLARQLLALEDGLGLHIVSNNSSLTPRLAVGAWRSFAAIALGCPSLVDHEFDVLG